MKKDTDLGLLIFRLMLGILMLFHGIAKVNHGISFIEQALTQKGLPGFLAYAVYIGEIIAPLMIIVGFRTRLGGLLLFINCLVAIILVHAGDIFKFGDHGGWYLELVGMYMIGGLALFFSGGGIFALSSRNKWD